MAWTKEEFLEFCTKCGVDPQKALKEGKINVNVTGATLGSIASKQIRRNRAIKVVSKIQDSLRESDPPMALDKTLFEQAEGMECPKVSSRVRIIGLRVRPIDPDNFTAGCKGIIDGLVASRIISGDDWKSLQIECSQRKVINYEDEGTLIEISSESG